MDITPHTNLLRSLRGERTNYIALIGEGVDNAFDAGASAISVTFTDTDVTFQDDGAGITRDRIHTVFSIGDHGAMATTQLGRFGVGIKSQAVNAGDTMTVISTSRDGHVRAEVCWREILKSGHWKIDPPRWKPVSVGSKTGTTIVISDLRRPPKVSFEKVRQDIAQRFHPAIADGKTISFNDAAVDALPEPALTDVIECHLALSNGRSATLRAGILASPSRLNRVHVAYRHRVIMPASTLGCGQYGGLTKMFARLQLSGPWHLAKFKDDLTDEDERDELEEAVEEALRPILEKCNSASMSARLISMANLLNDMVPPEIAAARPKSQNRRNGSKSSSSAKSGFVDQEKSTPDGPARSKRTPRDSLFITFDGVASEDGIGSFQPGGKLHRVDLSRDDPFVAELVQHKDEAFGAKCLLAIALMIFEEGRQSRSTAPEFQFVSFGMRISKQLSIQDVSTVAA